MDLQKEGKLHKRIDEWVKRVALTDSLDFLLDLFKRFSIHTQSPTRKHAVDGRCPTGANFL